MEILRGLLLILHFVGLAALFGVWFSQLKPAIAGQARILPGMLHGAYTALATGLGLVLIAELRAKELGFEVNHMKVGIKLVVLIVILVLLLMNRKREPISPAVHWAIGLLTLANICIAVLWK